MIYPMSLSRTWDCRIAESVAMIVVELENPDWTALRQAMALSLATGRNCSIEGVDPVLDSIHNRRMLDAVIAVLEEFPGCRLTEKTNSLLLENDGLQYGNFQVKMHPYVPLSEIVFLLAPALSFCEFRSELQLEGVTHSHLSYPSSYLKEALPSVIGKAGYTVASSLKRFGFYASGEGIMGTKVYPYEKREDHVSWNDNVWDIVDLRIFVSKIDVTFAEYQKQYLQDRLDPEDGVISIMEIINAAGYGNHIDVYMRSGDIMAVESMTMELYDESGEFIFSDEMMNENLDDLCKRVQGVIADNSIPPGVLREAAPFLHLAGISLNENGFNERIQGSTLQVCGLFSR